jgi:hypothetical protein
VAATGYETDVGQDPSHRLTWDAASWQFRADPEYSWSNPGYPQEDDHPAMRVSWNSACAFCDWLSTKEDKVYRLPTEAEWEYSCRAGTGTRFFPGDDESTLQGYGNVFDMSHEARVPGSVAVRKWTPLPWNDGFPFTAPVGRLKPNAYGLYDMHGNVGEWCADWFSSSYYGVSSLADPPGPLAGVERMVRDACFLNRGEPYMLSAFRARNFPDTTGEHVGFRVVLTIASSAAKSDEPGDFAGVPEFPDTPTVSTPPSALPDAKSAEVKAHFETGTSIDVTPRTGGPARASAEMPAAQSKAPAETADESKKATPTQANSSRAAEEANKTSAREKAESRYAQATAPIERLLAAWKFKEAAQELQQIKAEEADVAARLASQRDEVKRLIEIKSRIAQKINTTEPRLKKTALALRGMSGEATKADEEGITVTLASGKTELHAWDELGQKSVQSLIELVAEANSAEDWLAVGLLALRSQDLSLAERSLEKARSLGASIEPYLETLAPRAFAKAREFSAEKEYEKAAAALESIEQKYGKTAWFAANRKQFDAAEAEVREGEAEQIYAEAASLIASGDVFDARPLVERLKAEFATARAVTDAQRKPSFAEMDKATASLGRRIIVRSSGKADFRRIQDAVEAAVPNSCIEIQDNGPYNERIHIPPNKPRLVLRGGRGCWPIITDGPGAQPTSLLTFESEDATLERLVLIESGVRESCLLQHSGPAVEFRRCILYDVEGRGLFRTTSGGKIAVANSLILSPIPANSIELTMTNCILTARARLVLFNPSDLRQCTAADVELSDPITPQVILDSIIDRFVETKPAPHRLENCAFGMKPGAETKNCIFDNPRFRDPANLDFRLTGRSPCIGKASDGGDIGCRYTPEIAEICRVALELRRRGFLKF